MDDASTLELPPEEAGVRKALDTLDNLNRTLAAAGRLYVDLIRTIAEAAARFPTQTRKDWESLCQAGWRGQAAQVHSHRDELGQRVDLRRALIQQGLQVVREAGALAIPIPEPERTAQVLQQSLNELEAFQAEVLTRWQTLEDLEDLLAQTYPLANSQLAELHKVQPPFHPQWYAEDSKPF